MSWSILHRPLSALDVRVPIGKQTARARLPRPYVEIPNTEAVRLLECLPHDARRLGSLPRGDRHQELNTIELERAVGLLLVDQHLRMIEVERRVEERVVLEVVAHRAGGLMLDAVGDALVARRFGGLGPLEPGRRVTHLRNVAIDAVAEAAWQD